MREGPSDASPLEPPVTTAPHRPERELWIVLIALSAMLWAPRLRGPLDLRFDGAVYFVLGTSLAEGKGYRLLNEPGEIEAVQYPPLLPSVVAAHQWALGTNDFLVVASALRIFYFLLFTSFTVAVYWLARPYVSPPYALLAAAICALSLQNWYLSDLLYSEVPFALVTTLAAIWNRKSQQSGYAVLTALMAIAAYLVRTAGLALLAAWVAESLVRRRFKQLAGRALVALVPVLLWQVYISRVLSSKEYNQPTYAYQHAAYYYSNVSYAENTLLVDPFTPELGHVTAGEICRRIGRNVIAVPEGMGEALSVPAGFWKSGLRKINAEIGVDLLPLWLAFIPLVLLGCLAIGGTILLAIHRELFIPLYVAAAVGLICLTPWPQQVMRYLTPVTPFLALALVYALLRIREASRQRFPKRWKKIGSLFGVSVLAGLFFMQGVALGVSYVLAHQPVHYYDDCGKEAVYRLFFYDEPWQSLDTALEWVRRQAHPGDIIATTVPHWAYVRTGLKAVMPPMEIDSDRARRLLDSVPVRFVILDDLPYPDISPRYAAPAVEGHSDLWKCVYIAPGGRARVYERLQRNGT
jgi:hypothetical protein